MLVTFGSGFVVIGTSLCKVHDMYDILWHVLGTCMLCVSALI